MDKYNVLQRQFVSNLSFVLLTDFLFIVVSFLKLLYDGK